MTSKILHDCPALGKDTPVVKSLKLDRNREYVLMYQKRCPFCGYGEDEVEYAKGVTPRPDGGYDVDISIAEKVS